MQKPLISLACPWRLTLSLSFLLLATTLLAHGAKETVLYNFTGGSDAEYGSSALIFDTAGNLYGTSTYGGYEGLCNTGCGTVFKLTPNGSGFTESVVYSFRGSKDGDGSSPLGALTADAAGNFYGVTSAGGHNDCGTVFKLTPVSGDDWTESVLYSFCADGTHIDGVSPNGKLIFDATGNLYGTTLYGGPRGGGEIFQLAPSSGTWTLTVLHSFYARGRDLGGVLPDGIIFDSAGNIDGVTTWGGKGGGGVVFQLIQGPPGQWTARVLHHFSGSAGMQKPTGGLLLDSGGNLYMTMSGGMAPSTGAGVFQLSPTSGGKFRGHTLYSFQGGSPIQQPYEGLVSDSTGNLYSASYYGEYGGFVYELSPGSSHWRGTKLAVMVGLKGGEPVGGVVLDSKGNLYGATYKGGANRKGVVYQITP